MKITFLGNFDVPFSSENHHALSLESLGHEVIKLPEQRASYAGIIANAVNSDLFIWVHTHGWKIDKMDYAIKQIQIARVPTLSYHLDLYMGIKRWDEYKDSELFDLDYFFTVDPQMADWLNKNTKVKGYFMPAGVYDKECYIYEGFSPIKDVVFVGSRGYHEEWAWRPKLIDWLKETYKDKFEHWGGDGKGVIRGRELNILYASTKIVIGDTLSPNFNYPNYFSDRLFETTGRGGFIIFPYIKGIEDYFDLEKELITYTFGNFDDLKQSIDYFLTHDEERERIRIAGHERTKRDHTYLQRWAKILEVINK